MFSLGLWGAWRQLRLRWDAGRARELCSCQLHGQELVGVAEPDLPSPLITLCLLALPRWGLFCRPRGGEHTVPSGSCL